MIREHKPQPTFKIESIEEWLAKGGKIKRVNFDEAYEASITHFIKKYSPGTEEYKRHAQRMVDLRSRKKGKAKT